MGRFTYHLSNTSTLFTWELASGSAETTAELQVQVFLLHGLRFGCDSDVQMSSDDLWFFH